MAEFSRKADDAADAAKIDTQVDVRLGDELVASFAGMPGSTRIVVSEARRLDDPRHVTSSRTLRAKHGRP
jgi:hypothetical protein